MDRPLIPTDRMHRLEGWWVLGRSEVLVRKCYGCQRFRTEVSPNGCCAGCSKTNRTPPERAHPLEAGLLMRTAEPEVLDTEGKMQEHILFCGAKTGERDRIF